MLTPLENQIGLINKYGNTINPIQKANFLKKYLTEFVFSEALKKSFSTTKKIDDTETITCAIGNSCMVNRDIKNQFYIMLFRLSKSEYVSEIKGPIFSFFPSLIPPSETTMAMTSFAICFRFEQTEALSDEAKLFIESCGFKTITDLNDAEYFCADIDELLNS
jgi:hypothetical protein